MVELQAPENHLNGVGGVPLAVSTSKTVGSKRQRRPSVRLGDIGGQPYDSHVRKTTYTKQWKHHYQHQNHHHYNQPSNTTLSTKPPSKTKPLTTVTGGDFNEASFPLHEEEKDGNGLDTVAIGSWRVKDSKKRGAAKRIRSNWVSKMDETAGNNGDRDGDDNKFITGDDIDIDHDNDNDESYNREFDMENSEQSPIHSLENLGDGNERDGFYRRSIRDGGVELSGPSDNGGGGGGDGVRIWLNSIGLGRYSPVFEIHEVDDEVLPMLTLEDLKDMGINAVGSRRKMFCAIQKLGKGFS